MCLYPNDSALLDFDMAVDDQLRGSNIDVGAAGMLEEFKLSSIIRNESPTAKGSCLMSEV